MKIYTKKGDSGTTGLIGGTRVLKSSLRIESYGTIDELNSYIGVVGHQAVSFCHVARCVCRRSERLIVDLSQHEFVAELVTAYINRLSDYLFVLSRKIAQDLNVNEQPWKPRM